MRIFRNLEIFNNRDKFWQFLIRLALVVLIAFIFIQKIELSVIDLGRHLENGRLIFQSPDLLFKNFYSYTEPEHSFVNHHWLGGLIFYVIYFLGGFKLLTIFNVLLALAIFFSFFKLAQSRSNFYLAASLSLPVILLMNERTEIRPEMFSYLFLAITWLVLENKKLSRRRSFWILFSLFILWANIHIYFFLGLALVASYLLADFLQRINWREVFSKEELIKTKQLKQQCLQTFHQTKQNIFSFAGLFLAGLVNPNHIKGLFYPFNIFKNYGYQIAENKSILFLEKLFLNYNFQIFRLLLFILIFSLVANYIFQKKIRLADCFFGFFVSLLALLAVRNLTVFGLVSLVIISANLYPPLVFLGEKIKVKLSSKIKDFDYKFTRLFKPIFFSFFIFIFIFSAVFLLIDQKNSQIFLKKQFGLGLVEGSQDAFNFFIKNKIEGPIFNNYDAGSALIFGLAGVEKVFVDNRPEAYSVNFFEKEYLPMQTDEAIWQEIHNKYGFKSIIFSHADSTPWAKTFLERILRDKNWSLIYFDRYYVILVPNSAYSDDFLDEHSIDAWDFRQKLRNLVNDSNLKNRFNLAALAILIGQKDLAEEIYRQIIIEKPNNHRVFFALGNLYGSSNNEGDVYKAITYTQRGLAKEPNMPGSYNHLGLMYWSLSDYSQAEYYWRLALKKNRRDHEARNYLDQLDNLKKRGLLPR